MTPDRPDGVAPHAEGPLGAIVTFAGVCDQRGYADERAVSIGVWDGGSLPEFNTIMRLTVGDIRAMARALTPQAQPSKRESEQA